MKLKDVNIIAKTKKKIITFATKTNQSVTIAISFCIINF